MFKFVQFFVCKYTIIRGIPQILEKFSKKILSRLKFKKIILTYFRAMMKLMKTIILTIVIAIMIAIMCFAYVILQNKRY